MSEFTRPATWEDVRLLAKYLHEANVEYALIGGYAIAAHGFNRFSEDVDVLVNPGRQNTERWIEALARLPDGATKELTSEADIFQREGPYAIRINDEFTVDVMPAACGHSWEELRQFIQVIDLDGVPLHLLSLEGLLLTKEGMRDRDRADAAVLRKAIEQLQGNAK